MNVENNIAISLDKGQVTVLTLLDLSAASATIDHTTLTDRLAKCHGVSVSSAALYWFPPLSERHVPKIKI